MQLALDQNFQVMFLGYWAIGGLAFTAAYAFVCAISRSVKRVRLRKRELSREEYLAYVEKDLKAKGLTDKEIQLKVICEEEINATDKSGRSWRELDEIVTDLFRL